MDYNEQIRQANLRSASDEFPALVRAELKKARSKNGSQHSLHEGYAVLLEEVDEFWDIVKLKASKRDLKEALSELVQIAAMAQRTAEDVLSSVLARAALEVEEAA